MSGGTFSDAQRIYLLERELSTLKDDYQKDVAEVRGLVRQLDSRMGKVMYLSGSALISTLTAIIVVLVQVLATR